MYRDCGYDSICGNNNPGLLFDRDLVSTHR